MKYVGPDLSNPANYKRAVEEYNRRKQDAQRRGLIDDGNLHPDNFLRMQQRSEAPQADPRALMEEVIAELIAGSPSFDIGGERGNDMIAQGGIPVGEDPRLPMSREAFRQLMREKMQQRPALGAPQAPYDSSLLNYLLRGA